MSFMLLISKKADKQGEITIFCFILLDIKVVN